jgi:hypothetical protein
MNKPVLLDLKIAKKPLTKHASIHIYIASDQCCFKVD